MEENSRRVTRSDETVLCIINLMKAWRGTKICVTTSNISYIIMRYLSPRFDPRLSYFDSLRAFFLFA